MDARELDNRFAFHPATTPERQRRHEYVRGTCRKLARGFEVSLPAGRERDLALEKLEEVMFWANAAIARQDEAAEARRASSPG